MDDNQSKETNKSSEAGSSKPEEIPHSSGENSSSAESRPPLITGVPPSPPSFILLEEVQKVAEDVNKFGFNMALAHEIAVNEDFIFSDNYKKSKLREQVKEIFHKAFWDCLEEQLNNSPPVYTRALILLEEIKEIILGLLHPHSTRLRNEINEVLDIALIKQQAENGTIDFMSYAQFIISTMARMCAPVRDEQVQKLRDLTEVIPLYKGIFETLDVMRLDMVNFTLNRFRPMIQQHSVQLEKKKFQEILESLQSLTPPVDGLRFTRSWLQQVFSEISEESEVPSNAVALKKAYIKILTWRDDGSFPETLHLDHERFISLRNKLTTMVLTATVMLVTFSNVGPRIQGITQFKETLKTQAQVLLADAPQCNAEQMGSKMESVGLQVAKEVNQCLEAHGFQPLPAESTNELVQTVKSISDPEHSVRALIMKRLLEFFEILIDGKTQEKIPPGLSAFQQEISNFTGQFISLVRHNQMVFEEHYDEILNLCKKT